MLQPSPIIPVMQVDSHVPRDTLDRPVTQVAVGILIDGKGAFLLTTRPPGKAYAGHWEFPGGKVEEGETVQAALARELQEELGIRIKRAQMWKIQTIDYPHALVQLHFCLIDSWQHELTMMEGQCFAWQQLPLEVTPVLAGTMPVIDWFLADRIPLALTAPYWTYDQLT